jgi:ABC-type transport system involved in multi-copper enzyme maturation permease subunit
MSKLIKYDLRKIVKSKLFLASAILVPLLTLFVTWIVTSIFSDLLSYDAGAPTGLVGFIMSLPLSGSNYGITLLIILMIVLLAKDFSSGTIRNKIVAGYKRTEIFFASYIATVIATIAIIAVSYALSMFPIGFGMGPSFFTDVDIWDVISKVLTTFLIALFSITLSFILVYVLKSVGAPLGIMIGISIGFAAIATILNIIVQMSQMNGTADGYHLFQEIMAIIPYYQSTLLLDVTLSAEPWDFSKFIAYDLVEIAGVLTLGWVGFRKTDIK